jgi:hypothetical protein
VSSKRRPQLGDKISVNGVETIVIAFDLYQAEAPHFYMVTDSASADLRVEWREGVWAVPGAPINAAKKVPAPRVPNDFAKARNINPLYQAAKVTGEYAPALQLSADLVALHAALDESRNLYRQALERGDSGGMEAAWPRYQELIMEIDRRDPGFYIGRRNPLKARPRYVPPDLDYADISAGIVREDAQEAA